MLVVPLGCDVGLDMGQKSLWKHGRLSTAEHVDLSQEVLVVKAIKMSEFLFIDFHVIVQLDLILWVFIYSLEFWLLNLCWKILPHLKNQLSLLLASVLGEDGGLAVGQRISGFIEVLELEFQGVMTCHFRPQSYEVLELGCVLDHSLIRDVFRKFLDIVWEKFRNEACEWRVNCLVERQLQNHWLIAPLG